MFSLPFEQGPIRPVDEADSLLIRTTRGCPWNRCSFCSLYDTMKFSIRPVEEIKQDIWAARDYFGGHPFDTCFLQDGDSFVMRTKDLIAVLETLKSAFPTLRQISSYGRAQTMGALKIFFTTFGHRSSDNGFIGAELLRPGSILPCKGVYQELIRSRVTLTSYLKFRC
jgi:hypothetical protein